MKIQRLRDDEGARLRTIRLRSLRDAPEAFGSTLEETLARPTEAWDQQARDLPTFLAVERGRDVGIARGARDSDDPSRLWLLSMWVAPEARGKGLGEALVQAVIDWARSTPAAVLVLDVGVDNRPASALYERMGFVPNGAVWSHPPPREHIREKQLELELG